MNKKNKSEMTYSERILHDLNNMSPDKRADMFLYSCIQMCKLHLEKGKDELTMRFNYRVNGKQDHFVAKIKRTKGEQDVSYKKDKKTDVGMKSGYCAISSYLNKKNKENVERELQLSDIFMRIVLAIGKASEANIKQRYFLSDSEGNDFQWFYRSCSSIGFVSAYEKMIQGTVSEMFAKILISLMEYAKFNDTEVNFFLISDEYKRNIKKQVSKNLSISEALMIVLLPTVRNARAIIPQSTLSELLLKTEVLAQEYGIDIWYHVFLFINYQNKIKGK